MSTPYSPTGATYHTSHNIPAGTDKPRAALFADPYTSLADNVESLRITQRNYTLVGGLSVGATAAVPGVLADVSALSATITPNVGDWIECDFNVQLIATGADSAVAAHVRYFSTHQSIIAIPQSERAIKVTSSGAVLHVKGWTQATFAEPYTFRIGLGLNVGNPVNYIDTWVMALKILRGNY